MGTDQRCGKCKKTLPLDAFSPSYRGKTGKWCKGCHAAWARGERARTEPHDPLVCSYCKRSYVPKHRKDKAAYCSRECKEGDRRDSGRGREEHLRKKYGIGSEDYNRLLAKQDGGCALCGVKPEELTAGRYRTYLHVDHCHDSGRVRGLLCPEHNLLLGRFGDSPVMFRRVLEYLEAQPD